MPATRTETDSFGPIEVPADRYWAAQTERSLKFFKIGWEKQPRSVIWALGVIKRAAAEANIAVARAHARSADLEIDYRQASAEELAAGGERFDAVLALEVVEHVADVDAFLGATAALVRPGGALIASTLNRTPKSLLFAILGAEYVLRWLPRGTHRWDRFLRPSEFATGLRRRGLHVREISGLSYDLLTGEWRLGQDLGVNYLLFAIRPAD